MKIGKRIIGTLILPLIVLTVALVMSLVSNTVLFDSDLTLMIFVRGTVSVAIVTYALSINLNSGRFDFSLGSIALLSSIMAFVLQDKTNLGVFPIILLSILFGTILGAIHGGIYILTNLPPIIVSLGVTLLYEGFAYIITKGHGISIVTKENFMTFQTIPSLIVIILIVLLFIIVVFEFLPFGYRYRALISGQKTSVNTGIKERINAVICYSISGALMGLYGFISTTTNGSIQMSLNFGSIGPMFTAFLPMFIGGFIGNYSNDKLGYLLGGLCSGLISVIYVRFNVDSSIQQIVSAIILVVFLIYLNNQGLIKKFFSFSNVKKKKEQTN